MERIIDILCDLLTKSPELCPDRTNYEVTRDSDGRVVSYEEIDLLGDPINDGASINTPYIRFFYQGSDLQIGFRHKTTPAAWKQRYKDYDYVVISAYGFIDVGAEDINNYLSTRNENASERAKIDEILRRLVSDLEPIQTRVQSPAAVRQNPSPVSEQRSTPFPLSFLRGIIRGRK